MDENDSSKLKKDGLMPVESTELQQQQEDMAIQKPESRKRNLSVLWNWLEDFPSLRIALAMIMGIVILILLGVLIGYAAAVFNLIKL